MAEIHPTAIVEDGAQIGEGAVVGPFCHVGAQVQIGSGTRLISHVVVAGRTTLGTGNTLYPFSSIGHAPQDLKYKGEPSTLTIGDNNTIREHVTMNPGTEGGGMVTRVGSSCLFMASTHVGHDCILGDHIIMANNATLGGHCNVEDYALLGGLSAVHQFVRIGAHACLGGMSGLEYDLIPFGTAVGDRASLVGLNMIGLKRRGFTTAQRAALREAYARLFASDATLNERTDAVAQTFPDDPGVAQVVAFIRAPSRRSLCLPATPTVPAAPALGDADGEA